MAYIQINFYSNQLRRNVPISAFIPNDIPEGQCGGKDNDEPMKTLYLLPGFAGNHQDWILNACLQNMSSRFHLAIISLNGENSFYVDREATGYAYGKYVGEELVDYTRRLFNLSCKREDTFIGGFSMGGFGALRNGLKYNQTFSKIIALSSALIIHEMSEMTPDVDNGIANYEYYTSLFGDLSKVIESDKNPETFVLKHQKEGNELPEIYMACGTEDFLIEHNRAFKNFLQEQQVTFTYTEDSGVHDWNFWNTYIEKAINWLNLEERS
ncbi:MAG: acetylesterase [Cellulosilyticum sp.]|nr:acetylesterase [Cellulosilyticum sp.]